MVWLAVLVAIAGVSSAEGGPASARQGGAVPPASTISKETRATLVNWGNETLANIRQAYYMPAKHLYGDAVTPGKPPEQVAFNWGCGVMLSALNAASSFDPKYKPELREFASALQVYWNTKGPTPGYDVLPAPKDVDRYYDDNEWLVLGLVETSERLNAPEYLHAARQGLAYVLSGEDDKLGGGIYWRETDKASKNTCSNAPAAAACLAVYRFTHDGTLLAKAEELYDWAKRTLQDPEDHLMWDNINLSGKIGKAKFSYNTALMIRTAAELARLTKEAKYEADTKEMVQASLAHWFKEGKLHDDGRFAHLLVDAWIEAERMIPSLAIPKEAFVEPLQFVHEHGRSSEGFIAKRWDEAAPKPGQKCELIDQASFVRSCFDVAKSP